MRATILASALLRARITMLASTARRKSSSTLERWVVNSSAPVNHPPPFPLIPIDWKAASPGSFWKPNPLAD